MRIPTKFPASATAPTFAKAPASTVAPTVTCAIPRSLPTFEIRHRSEVKAPTSTTRIFSNGAWTYQAFDADGDAVGSMTKGCLDREAMKTVKLALRDATWKITDSPIACFAYSPSYTEYAIRGRVMFREQMCSGSHADAVTQESIAKIEKVLPAFAITPPQPVAVVDPADPVDTVECAVPRGKPVFEIRHRSALVAATATTSIYNNGTWTYEPVSAAGVPEPMSRGCLGKTEMKTIKSALRDAPWTITRSQVTCKAYSPSYTEYAVLGIVKFRAQLCSGASADAVTVKSIATIEGLLPALAITAPQPAF